MEPCCCRDRWSPAAYSSSDGGTEESLGSVPAWSPTRRGGGDARESLGLPPSWRGGHAPGGDAKVCPGPGCQGAHVSHCVHAGCCLLLRRKERRLPPRLLLRPRLEICQGRKVDKGYYGVTGSPCYDEGETGAHEIPVVGFRVEDTGARAELSDIAAMMRWFNGFGRLLRRPGCISLARILLLSENRTPAAGPADT